MSRSRGPHVAFYTDTEASVRGGAEQVLAYLLEALDPRYRVTLAGVDEAMVSALAERRPGAGTLVLPPVRHKGDLRAIAAHVRGIRGLRPDVLHVNHASPWTGQYAVLAGLLAPGTRVVSVEHAVSPTYERVQRAQKRLFARRLAAHVAVGERSARTLEAIAGLRPGSVTVIPNGVPAGPPAPPRPARGPAVVGMISRIDRHKGVDVLVRALSDLPEARGLIVGDGPALEDVRRLAEETGVGDRVRLTGYDPSARERMMELDVFVLPSRFESLPLGILEAMVAGLPVVATDVGSVSEAVIDGETGLLVEPGDAAGLAAALRRLLDDPELRKRMGRCGRERVLARFSENAMARAYERLYSQILDRAA